MTAPLKLLELAERGRKASAQEALEAGMRVQREIAQRIADAQEPMRQTARQLAEARYRAEHPPASIDRGPVCPSCDGLACRDGKRLVCCWCGCVTERSNGGWSVVDACMLFDGSWPDVEHATGGSST